MTFRIPQPNIFDRFLRLLGKKRGVKIPTEAYEKFGPHIYAKANKENFFKALVRSPDQDLPEGFVDVFSMSSLKAE